MIATKSRASDLFDNLGRENELPAERKLEVRANRVEKIKEIFYSIPDHYKINDEVLHAFERFTADDIFAFSITLRDYERGLRRRNRQSYFSGVFLSDLINFSQDEDFRICTVGLEDPPQFLCRENRKNVIITGNVGPYLGYRMVSGLIKVHGNVGSDIGCQMQGGRIEIFGRYMEALGGNGRFMTKGEIYAKGKLLYKDGGKVQ